MQSTGTLGENEILVGTHTDTLLRQIEPDIPINVNVVTKNAKNKDLQGTVMSQNH